MKLPGSALMREIELPADVAAMAKLLGSELPRVKWLDELLAVTGGYGFMSEYKIGVLGDARVAPHLWRHIQKS